MNNKNRELWLSINPFVHLETKKDATLLYNTLSKKAVVIKDKKMIAVFQRIHTSERGGFVISQQEYESDLFQKLNNLFRKYHFGKIYTINQQKEPFVFRNELFFEKNLFDYSGDKNFTAYHSKDLFEEMLQVNVYVTSYCENTCSVCHMAAKQSLFCYSDNSTSFMSCESFHNIMQMLYHQDGVINILGGDISKYPRLDRVMAIISAFPQKSVNLFLNSTILESTMNAISSLIPPNLSFVLLFNSVKEYKTFIHSNQIPMIIIKKRIVLVFSESDLLEMKSCDDAFVTVIPIYDGSNIGFFEQFVYINEKDLQDKKMSLEDILINKKMNVNNYGIINVFPDGTVKTNFNNRSLGNLSEGLENLLWREMKRKDGWMKTRTEKPCSECVYQYLCPPPSNYEIAIGKPNLCTIKP